MGPYLGVRDVPHCHGVVVEDAIVAEVAAGVEVVDIATVVEVVDIVASVVFVDVAEGLVPVGVDEHVDAATSVDDWGPACFPQELIWV